MYDTNAIRSDVWWRRHARAMLTALTLATTAIGTWGFAQVLAADGLRVMDGVLAALFAVLAVWVAFSFWTATMGLVAIVCRSPREALAAAARPISGEPPPTAILMPIYNEDPTSVFAGLRAIIKSLRELGSSRMFDLFVLSDTTDPDIWLEEERAWARLVSEQTSHSRVFYRHRARNLSRKSGNIADFCTRWGDHYRYMIVLDADSVMDGKTMVEMVRRMEEDPEIGILQAPPMPVNRKSVFARVQQFAAHLYGPVFLEGFALWAQRDGNYWGHNAIIRIQPFMEHCDLPVLPGKEPLGGEILSHDFVEAALMRRGGWKVCVACDLDGSYEECPTTILAYAQRDQRWCQGNLQHTKLVFAEGLHPASRLHFSMGVMSYVSSPLWLLFLVLSVPVAVGTGTWFAAGTSAAPGAILFGATMAMLLLPKLWGLIALSRQPQRVVGHGGWKGAIISALLETVMSVLIAPIMMLLHTQFVVATLLGHKVSWNAQSRSDRGVSFRDAIAVHYLHTLFGLAAGFGLWLWAPGLLPWMSPVLLGLVISIPLSMFLSSVNLGQHLASHGLLLTPEEIERPSILKYQRDALTGVSSDRQKLFGSVLYDPAFYALHVGILRATDSHVPASSERLESAIKALSSSGAESVPLEVRRAILNDARALERLHVHARSHCSSARSTLVT